MPVSFIFTVTALAAAACGGSTTDHEGGTTERDIVQTNPPHPDAPCPDAEPVSGAACAVEASKMCGYKDCGGFPSVHAKCTAGAWTISERSK